MKRRVRLTPSASVTETGSGVVLRSDLGTFQLEGADVGVFVRDVLPLLDGSRDRSGVADELEGYSRESTTAFLDALESYGLLEEVPYGVAEDLRLRGQDEFLKLWGNEDQDRGERLRQAGVVLVGLEPWGAVAAMELAAAGLGRLTLVEDAAVQEDDLLGVRFW